MLRLVAVGLSDADVAEQLYLSVRTVNAHLRSIYRKAGVSLPGRRRPLRRGERPALTPGPVGNGFGSTADAPKDPDVPRLVHAHAATISQHAQPTQLGVGLTVVSAVAFAWIGVLTQLGYDAGATIGTMLSGRFLIAAALLWSLVALTRPPPARRHAVGR